MQVFTCQQDKVPLTAK